MQKKALFFFSAPVFVWLFVCLSLNSWGLVWCRRHLQSAVFYPAFDFSSCTRGVGARERLSVKRNGVWLKDPVQTVAICISNMHGRYGWWWWWWPGQLLALAGNPTPSRPSTNQIFDSCGWVANYFSRGLRWLGTRTISQSPPLRLCLCFFGFCFFSPMLVLFLGTVQNLSGLWGTTATLDLPSASSFIFFIFFFFVFSQQPLIFQVPVWAPPAVLFWLWPTSAYT